MSKERNEEELNKEESPAEKPSPEDLSDAEASDDAEADDEAFEEPDYEAILNDGWADDVILDYPKLDNTDDNDTDPPDDDTDPANNEQPLPEKKASSSKKTRGKKEAASSVSKKKHGFRLFMLLWLGSLIVLLTLALSYFYDFLLHYEESYPSSLPEREMDRIIELLATSDMDDIYRFATTPPPVAEGRSETDTKRALLHLLNDPSLSYRMLTVTDRSERDYEITVQDKAIGKATLLVSPVDTLDYGLPLWYLSSLEFYAVESPSEEAE